MLRCLAKRTVFSPATIVGVLAMMLGFCIYSRYDMGILYALDYSISLGYLPFFLPIAAVFPACYMQRYLNRKGVSQLILFRSNRRSYILSNLFSAHLSGMVVVAVSFLLFTLVCFLNLWPDPVTLQVDGKVLSYVEYEGELLPWDVEVNYEQVGYFYCILNDSAFYYAFPFFAEHHVIFYLVKGLLLMLQGGMYTMISLACYALLQNHYVALVFPFLCWVAFNFAATTTQCAWLDSGQLTLTGAMASEAPYGGLSYFVVYIAVVFLLCGGFWGIRTMRRCRNG